MMTGIKTREEIREYCRILKLKGVADNFESLQKDAEDYYDYLQALLRCEIGEMEKRTRESRIRCAKFPYRKYLEDLEMDCLPPAMQKKLPELATLDFVEKGQNVILTGNPGTGKTHVAIGLGIKACEQGYRVLYTTVPLLVTELKECNDEGRLRGYERRFAKYDLIIADELGYVSFDRAGAELLFNNLSLRAATKSTIVTSNLTFERWGEVFGDPAMTSAMVDRLTYKAIMVDMEGDSYRLRETLRLNGSSLESVKK